MMTPPTPEIVETKVCKGCAEAWPITEFRLRRRGGEDRMNLCRICHNDRERERRQAKERALQHSVAEDYVRRLIRREGNADEATVIAARQLGGVKQLSRAVGEYLRVAPPSVNLGYFKWMVDQLKKREKRR